MNIPTDEVLKKIIPHADDRADVIEAFEEDTVEYLPHNLVLILIENNLWDPNQ